jgi:SpoVK/Ycf46/Vps4 family AAA+-type ATPase
MNSNMNYDPLTYNNCVLTHNIAMLSSIPVSEYYKTKDENASLKKLNDELFKSIEELKKKLDETKDRLDRSESYRKQLVCENHDKKNQQQYYMSRFKTINFQPSKTAWTDDKINKTISSIKSINDIINLDSNWYALRHNPILQRLYYLIPPLKKLNQMIGLNDVKRDVYKKIIYYMQNPFDERTGCNEYLHTIISGPPGVGKTEFAKIYADIFVRLGILKSDKFIEIKRDDLIGEYLGQTSHRTRDLLESAMNGVLFLDEAYSLGNEEKRDSYSKEAIDMINQYLSEKKGKFMFIIAGYEEDLESCLFAYNKGLKRRFHSHYHINGYEPAELNEIFIGKIGETKYYTDIPKEKLIKFFTENKLCFSYFGGDIEKLFNEIKQSQALRTFSSNTKSNEIIMEDITESLKTLNGRNKKEYAPPMGMYV